MQNLAPPSSESSRPKETSFDNDSSSEDDSSSAEDHSSSAEDDVEMPWLQWSMSYTFPGSSSEEDNVQLIGSNTAPDPNPGLVFHPSHQCHDSWEF